MRVHNAPEFPVMAVDDEAGLKELQRFGRRLSANCGYIADAEKRLAHQNALKEELKMCGEDKEKVKALLTKELEVRFKGDKALDVLGIPVERSIAMGDGPNDIEVLVAAGTAVATDNATQQVKDICDLVTASSVDGGVGLAIEKLLL